VDSGVLIDSSGSDRGCEMTKQEEISKGLAQLTELWIQNNYPIGSQTFSDLADQSLAYLHSQGVVIKVDRELPDNAIYYPPKQLESYNAGRQIMISGGYVAVEPLIEEKS